MTKDKEVPVGDLFFLLVVPLMLFCSLFLLSSHPLTSLVHVSSEYLETRQGQDKVGILYYAHYDSSRSKCRFKSA